MREIVEKKVLSENDRLAAQLRQRYNDRNIFCVNLISSPGSGKTALLERTLASFTPKHSVAVLTGDIQTDNDARRLSRYGFPVRQIVTGGTCHLDARMIDRHLTEMGFQGPGLLLIENVGNLVCPSSYDLGEAAKIVLLSVTEGEDKPLKYPNMFRFADIMILNKTDLLPHLHFQPDECVRYARRVNPRLEILPLSAATGDGLDAWCEWLRKQTPPAVPAHTDTRG